MERAHRLSTWLRVACGLILAVGFSTATTNASTGEQITKAATTAVSQLSVTASAAQTGTFRAATAVRHAAAKHHTPGTSGALAVAALALTGFTAFSVRRRRTDPVARHDTRSHGARAPPAVSSC